MRVADAPRPHRGGHLSYACDVEGLQGIKDPERALVALEALQSALDSRVDWSINDFAVRSLHPVLRQGVAAIKAKAVAS